MVSRASSLTDAAASPFDFARRGMLSLVARNRLAARAVGTRDVRVPLVACVQVTLLFVVATVFPVVAFVVGPLVLGVPHLASDVRYLLVRARVPRTLVWGCAAGATALLALRVLALVHHGVAHSAMLEVGLGIAWVAGAFVAGARERALPAVVQALVLAALAGLGAWMITHAGLTRLCLAHAHNVVGIAIWFVLFRRNKRVALAPLAAIAVGAGVLAAGVVLPTTLRLQGDQGLGLALGTIGRGLAPGLAPHAAAAVATSFVFLQSVHYATWLVWVPQEELPGQGTFTFRMTGRALVRDLGPLLLATFALVWAALAGWGLFQPLAALQAYVTLVSFHAWFELASFAYLFTRRASWS